jgi:GT2 family glycosyltransferase
MTIPRSQTELVSVVIVNYNGAEVLRPCLQSVFAQPYMTIEVLVVDNGSTDGSREIVKKDFPAARWLPQGSNLGFAEGNNAGVRAAQGDIVLLLNNDTEVEAGWIPGMLSVLSLPGVGVVTSRVVTDGVPAEFYAMNGSVNYLGYNIMKVFADLSCVFFGGGASLMFRKSVVGDPFPKEYFLYQEDLFLSWRLRLAGHGVRMAQDSVVRHRGSATTKKQPGRLVTFYQERNRVLNCLILYSPGTLVRLFPLGVADAVAKMLLSVVGGRKSLRGIVEGYLWCVTHAGWICAQRRHWQQTRRVRDGEIMQWMSPAVAQGSGRPSRLLNLCARTYARLVGLSFYA